MEGEAEFQSLDGDDEREPRGAALTVVARDGAEDEAEFVRKCEDMCQFMLDTGAEVIGDGSNGGGENEYLLQFIGDPDPRCGRVKASPELEQQIVGIMQWPTQSAAGSMAKKAVLETYVDLCEDACDVRVIWIKAICRELDLRITASQRNWTV